MDGFTLHVDETSEIEHEGFTLTATIHRDETYDPPWDAHDGHGPVSDWTRRQKAPGERILCEDGAAHRLYDFAEAVKIARRDGWRGLAEDTEGTPRQIAVRAAEADFQRLRDWCNDGWWWVGVAVTVSRADVQLTGKYEHALWGIESDAGPYLNEVAQDLAEEALKAARAKLAELSA